MTLERRTPLRAKTPWRPKRKPIRARSARQQKLYDVRVPIIREAVERGQRCEACPLIAQVDMTQANRCTGRAVDWHEVKTRARGGSILDPANRVWACRSCHDWIDLHQPEAHAVGLLRHSWE